MTSEGKSLCHANVQKGCLHCHLVSPNCLNKTDQIWFRGEEEAEVAAVMLHNFVFLSVGFQQVPPLGW